MGLPLDAQSSGRRLDVDEPCEDVKDAGDCTALLDAFV